MTISKDVKSYAYNNQSVPLFEAMYENALFSFIKFVYNLL